MTDEGIFDSDPPLRTQAERWLRSGDVDAICSTLALLARPYADVHLGGEWAWLTRLRGRFTLQSGA